MRWGRRRCLRHGEGGKNRPVGESVEDEGDEAEVLEEVEHRLQLRTHNVEKEDSGVGEAEGEEKHATAESGKSWFQRNLIQGSWTILAGTALVCSSNVRTSQ